MTEQTNKSISGDSASWPFKMNTFFGWGYVYTLRVVFIIPVKKRIVARRAIELNINTVKKVRSNERQSVSWGQKCHSIILQVVVLFTLVYWVAIQVFGSCWSHLICVWRTFSQWANGCSLFLKTHLCWHAGAYTKKKTPTHLQKLHCYLRAILKQYF